MTAKKHSTTDIKWAVSCLLALFALGCTEPVSPDETMDAPSPLEGSYVVVAIRRASDVAAPAMPEMDSASPVGQVITFQGQSLIMEGINCDSWTIEESDANTIPVAQDPNLIDLTLAPTDSPKSAGGQRIGASYEIGCEGEYFASVFQVDDRVMVMPWANSAFNLILEKPLTPAQIKQYQSQLKSMKFYDGDATGTLDAPTQQASRRWYSYRAALDDTQPIPARPAITENLLDALGVLEN